MEEQGGGRHYGAACKFIIILFVISTGFFCTRIANKYDRPYINKITEEAKAAPADEVVINEIAWMGTELSSSDEWIELRNLSGSEISLDGWTLEAQDGSPIIEISGVVAAGGYYLLERSNDETVPNIDADSIYTGALGNGGETLTLKDEQGAPIDIIDAGGGWPAGDNGNKLTMERSEAGGWKSGALPGGTPRAANSADGPPADPVCGNGELEPGEECDDNNTKNNDGCNELCQFEEAGGPGSGTATTTPDDAAGPGTAEPEDQQFIRLGGVVINELVSDPADNEVEWVELYNTLDIKVDISGWTLAEGAGRETVLSGILKTEGEGRFQIVKKPKGNLNNQGDLVELRDVPGALIDRVAYGSWDDGDKEDNAPAAPDPKSLARKSDGYNSRIDSLDFVVTDTPTPGRPNIISGQAGNDPARTEDEEASAEERAEYDYSSGLIISEVLPNPRGSDRDHPGEFIELYNRDSRSIELAGWRLGDNSKKRFRLDKRIIGPKEYILIHRQESGLALNNSEDSVKLYRPLENRPWQEVFYQGGREGQSYSLIIAAGTPLDKQEYAWTGVPTPGQANQVKKENQAPKIHIDCPEQSLAGRPVLFDASDTLDPEGDELVFYWDFGDQATNTLAAPEHTYFATGTFTVRLRVEDPENTSEQERIIRIVESEEQLLNPEKTDDSSTGTADISILINEFMADPVGDDGEYEWIELYNSGSARVHMQDWQLDDSEGGSRPYRFGADFYFNPDRYVIMGRDVTGLALNNSGDAIRLFDREDRLVDSVEYEDAKEGEAMARGLNNAWFTTTAGTPGMANVITLSESYDAGPGAGTALAKPAAEDKGAVHEITLDRIHELGIGDRVRASGTVAVLPGVLGAQYFYIVGSPGIQVYSYKKDFPELRVGDRVLVRGEISQSNEELRIKTSSKDDIELIQHAEAPAARPCNCADVKGQTAGQLIELSGEIVAKKGSSLYLDDGTDEMLVYIKSSTNINTERIKEGDKLAISGILGRTRSGLRLLPRSEEDIVVKDRESRESRVVMGRTMEQTSWELAQRRRELTLYRYLLVTAGAIIIILSGLLIKVSRGRLTLGG